MLGRFMLSFFTFIAFGSIFYHESSFASGNEERFEAERCEMVEHQIKARGVKDPHVLHAMLSVRRHLFVPPDAQRYAYEDSAMPIGLNQTISQPYIVALMTELAGIGPSSCVLEIGTGTGYQAAVLAEIAEKVYSIEIIGELAENAEERLKKLGYKNIEIKHGDGYAGWPEKAPFDAIIVTAAAPAIPEELLKELRTGGRMVIPLGDIFQELYVLTKNKDGSFTKEHIIPVRFVPMVRGKKTDSRP